MPPMPALVQLATPARAVWASAAGLAFASLPRWARRLYGLPGLPTTDLGASVTLRWLRAGVVGAAGDGSASHRHTGRRRSGWRTPVRRLARRARSGLFR